MLSNLKHILIKYSSPVYRLDQEMFSQTETAIKKYSSVNEIWLDLGCGLRPYEKCFSDMKYIGIDIADSGRPDHLKQPDIQFNGQDIPFPSNYFDGVLCTQVLEHATNFEKLLQESHRVLRNNGKLIISVPFTYREHEIPFDFRRFTSFGLVAEVEKAGYLVEEVQKCLSGIETIATLTNSFIANNFGYKNRLLFFFTSLFFIIPISFWARILSKMVPDNGDLYCTLVLVGGKNIGFPENK